ncbi:Protein of unknown function [Nocardia farcinica]|uniref:Protein of uncharacterized function (DUF3140) n=1 Tax=Nocardia farcinica TaxID=37329 RepID=A0A0H5NFU8_NOCFR|nr:hypothetical protein CJ469_01632 [Nocardia farcinica]PFX09916.1 hypothetical protein CJ468_00763 [Nocardia farcinica]CRY74159.1 Protein of uncharacterised function (DUF3140) [Nocardia farcinica]SIT23425.1 Protein of unknown function [Nocardia farcinica]SUE27572.1 Protein of uncharacterised function (DUF3140) [Nocardia farcinica]
MHIVAETEVDQALWDEFHRLVNMSSRQLGDWLRTEGAGPRSETEPDHAGPELGRRILAVLGKRRTDLSADDIEVMRRAVDEITAARGAEDDGEPRAGSDEWRRRLMSLGHDPLQRG